MGQSVSYVKNLLRMHVSLLSQVPQRQLGILLQVRDTLYGADPRGVTDATREAMKKFVGQGKQPDAKDVIYMLFIVSSFCFQCSRKPLTLFGAGWSAIMLAETGPFLIKTMLLRVMDHFLKRVRAGGSVSVAVVVPRQALIFGPYSLLFLWLKEKSGAVIS